ncbi:hypothetical protein Hanom_Chr12g01141381 [Helianthus anomalus]
MKQSLIFDKIITLSHEFSDSADTLMKLIGSLKCIGLQHLVQTNNFFDMIGPIYHNLNSLILIGPTN